MEEEKIGKVDLKVARQSDKLGDMVEAGLITEQGFRIQGMGLVLKKLDETWKKLDQISLRLWQLEKDKK